MTQSWVDLSIVSDSGCRRAGKGRSMGGVVVEVVPGVFHTLAGGERHALLFKQDDWVAAQLDPVRRDIQISQ
jgi:hypothetical protein